MLNSIQGFLFENVNAKQIVLKNTFWLGVSTGITKLFSLALVIYAARILGAEGYGQFTFALALVSLFVVFPNLGVSSIIVREFARENEQKEQLYSLISLRVVLTLSTFLLIMAASLFVTPSRDVQMMIFILALFVLLNSVLDLCYSFFHARQKMEYEAWFEMIQIFMIVGLGLLVLFRFPSPVYLSYAHFFAALATLVFVAMFFHRKVFPLKIKWDILVWKKFLKMSWPLAFMGMFGAVYSYTDSVMLGYWGMMEETGWYNAAYKIVAASLIPTGFVGAAFYPALSRFFSESAERFQRAWNYEFEIMIALAVPLVVGGIVLAPGIIFALYPADFSPATLAFQILIVTAGLMFLYRPMYDAMVVLNQQKKTFWITVAGAVVNVVLNFILIPKYSLYGAALATACTHFLTLVMMLFFLKKFTFLHFPLLKIGLAFAVAATAAAAMYGVITYPLFRNIHIFFLVAVGATAYVSVFVLLRQYVLPRYFKQAYA